MTIKDTCFHHTSMLLYKKFKQASIWSLLFVVVVFSFVTSQLSRYGHQREEKQWLELWSMPFNKYKCDGRMHSVGMK